MRNGGTNPMNSDACAATKIESTMRQADDRSEEPFRHNGALRREDSLGQTMPADRQQAQRPMQAARRQRRRAQWQAERRLAARQQDQRGEGPAKGDPKSPPRGGEAGAERQVSERLKDQPLAFEDTFGEAPFDRKRTFTSAERAEAGERHRKHMAYWDGVYRQLGLDAQACARSMSYSPALGGSRERDKFEEIVSISLDDYRTGRSLMAHLGADRLIDPATTGMLLGIRRGLLAETHAATIGEYVLVDMVVVAFANQMRLQSIVGNTALCIESEMFGQPSLRAKWQKQYGGRPEETRGFAVEEHMQQLIEQIMPLVERFNRMGREGLEALGRARQAPSLAVERAEGISVVLVE
jgi:hypothetical protein